MSLTIVVISAVVAASAGYLALRRRRTNDDAKVADTSAKRSGKGAPSPSNALEGFGLAIGDVISSGGEERWLSGALLAREQTVITVLFFAPEGREHWVVAAFPLPERDIFWLRPVEVVSPAEPPATLEIDGFTMQRKRRLPVRLERMGQGAPAVDSTGMLATYTAGARDVAIVLTCGEQCLGWSGRRIESSEYDRMGQSLNDD